MPAHIRGSSIRRVGAAVVLGATSLTACFLPTPPLEDATTEVAAAASSSSGDAPSSGEMPTTGGETSSGAVVTTTGDSGEEATTTSTSTTTGVDDPSTSGTTEFSLPQCPYEPSGAHVTLVTTEAGTPTDLTTQPCGTEQVFDRLKLVTLSSTLTLSVCSDGQCGDCDPKQTVELGLGLPDPFTTLGGDVTEEGCFEVGVRWERATAAPDVCAASRVVLRRIEGGAPTPVPSVLYRLAGALDVTDEVGEFALTAAIAGDGPVACPCEGDCCRDAPGSRVLQFAADVGGEVFLGDPLEAEQQQFLPLGADDLATIALIRGHFPSACGEPGAFEWVFRHPEIEF